MKKRKVLPCQTPLHLWGRSDGGSKMAVKFQAKCLFLNFGYIKLRTPKGMKLIGD